MVSTLLAIFYGLIMGSFLNVVIHRLPKGESVVRPRSRCPSCERPIPWYENIPVASYLALRGRCRGCLSSISIRYPLIELLTALLFLAAKLRFGFDWMLVARDWPFLALLVAVTFIDLEHRIIPNPITIGGTVLGLLTAWWVPGLGLLDAAIGAAAGFGVFYIFALLFYLVTGKHGLGGGDVKLLAMFGAFLGWQSLFTIVLISSLAGSVIGIGWALASGKRKLVGTSIPYGPFLVLGALYYYLLGDLIWLPFTTPI